jgi:hypothetical protein
MGLPQGNSLCSYLKQAKMPFFSFSFFLIQNQRKERQKRSCRDGEVGASGRRRRWGKGEGRWILCKYCVHMYVNGKK